MTTPAGSNTLRKHDSDLTPYEAQQEGGHPASNTALPKPPTMRQRELVREKDDDPDIEIEEGDVSNLTECSEPEIKHCTRPNSAPLELESRDKENFVYTKAHFREALANDDVNTLVRMLRYGVMADQKPWGLPELTDMTRQLIKSEKFTLMAELIKESEGFRSAFCDVHSEISFCAHHAALQMMMKLMNDHRELPKDFKVLLLEQWWLEAIRSKNPNLLKSVVQIEADILYGEGHEAYCRLIQYAGRYAPNFLSVIIENMLDHKHAIKSGIDLKSYAAALNVLEVSRADLIALFQDASLNQELKNIENKEENVEISIGANIRNRNGLQVIHQCMECIQSIQSDFNAIDDENLLADNARSGDSAESDEDHDRWYICRAVDLDSKTEFSEPALAPITSAASASKITWRQLIRGGVRPVVASALSEIFNECASASMSFSPFSDSPEIQRIVLAAQLKFLRTNKQETDPVAAAQVQSLQAIGEQYIKSRLGAVRELIAECFEFADGDFILDPETVGAHLKSKYGFPNALALFLAVTMSSEVAAIAAMPAPVFAEGTSIKEAGQRLKQMVKTTACQSFIKKFGEIVKQQQLITLFNEDAEGRDGVWANYFYAYLDELKAGLSAPGVSQ